jgi:CRP/FNR family transcriptional regulator, anaerobic regulatory protein
LVEQVGVKIMKSNAFGNETGGPILRVLGPNEQLFRTGEVKSCIYRVERGAVATYERQWNGSGEAIDFAFPGDLVGLGFLEFHTSCARTLVESELTCWPKEALAKLIACNSTAQLKLDDAIEREFEFRRASLVGSSQRSPLARVAAYFVFVSRLNAHEGRNPLVIDDSCPCAFVAESLGLSVETLAYNLSELAHHGIVSPRAPSTLRIDKIEALERIADQAIGGGLLDNSPFEIVRSQRAHAKAA